VVCAVWVSPERGFLWSVVCRLCELQLWWLWVSLEDSAYDFEAEGTHLELRAVRGSTRDSEINDGFENQRRIRESTTDSRINDELENQRGILNEDEELENQRGILNEGQRGHSTRDSRINTDSRINEELENQQRILNEGRRGHSTRDSRINETRYS